MTRTIWCSASGIREREFDRKPHAILTKVDPVDQRRQRLILFKSQTRAPYGSRFEKRSDSPRVEAGLFNCGDHRLLVIENALGSGRDAALDLCGGQAPAAIHANGGAFHQAPRNVVAIAPVALY